MTDTMSEKKNLFQVGDTIAGNYEVLDILGQGSVGTVYLVKNTRANQLAALKALNPGLANSPKARAIFLREAEIWTSLEPHPNIVHATHIVNHGEQTFLIMEYIPPGRNGENSLAGYMRIQKLDIRQIHEWSIQFCKGMTQAYNEGIGAHRDIKPQNILITNKKVLKISDFGLASVMSISDELPPSPHEIPADIRRKDSLTSCVGTYTYMSPEHYKDADLCDERSDIYSFGVVLFQMVSGGKLPFLATPPANASQEEMNRFVSEMQKLHSEAQPPSLHSPLDPIIQKCLAKDPDERYGAFEWLQKDLEDQLISQDCTDIERPTRVMSREYYFYDQGLGYQKASRFEDAIQSFQKAEEFGLGSADLYISMAECYASLGKMADALYFYDKAISGNLGNPHPVYRKGIFLAGLGNHEEALSCFAQSLSLLCRNPEFEKLYWNPFVRIAEDPKVRTIYERLLNTPKDQLPFIFGINRLSEREDADDCFQKEGVPVSRLSSSHRGRR